MVDFDTLSPTLQLFIKAPVVAACIAIIGACICRVDKMNVRDGSSILWVLKYIGFAVFSLGMMIDWLRNVYFLDWYELVGVMSIGLHIYFTKDHWDDKHDAPPPESQAGDLT